MVIIGGSIESGMSSPSKYKIRESLIDRLALTDDVDVKAPRNIPRRFMSHCDGELHSSSNTSGIHKSRPDGSYSGSYAAPEWTLRCGGNGPLFEPPFTPFYQVKGLA